MKFIHEKGSERDTKDRLFRGNAGYRGTTRRRMTKRWTTQNGTPVGKRGQKIPSSGIGYCSRFVVSALGSVREDVAPASSKRGKSMV